MFSLKAHIDPSGLEKAFEKMREDMRKQGKGLAFENAKFFVRMAKKISGDESTPTAQEIEAKRSLGWRLKIKDPNITTVQGWYKRSLLTRKQVVDQEIARRIRAIGTYKRAWRMAGFSDEGWRIRIWITNTVGYAKKINERDHTAEKSAEYVAKVFQRKLHSAADRIFKKFGR